MRTVGRLFNDDISIKIVNNCRNIRIQNTLGRGQQQEAYCSSWGCW